MLLAGKVWNDLGVDDRRILLRQDAPRRSGSLIDSEAKRDWESLLPSTQDELLDLDWSRTLGKDVQPD